MKHVVMFSGGIGSWAAAKRVAEQYGTDDMVLLFADVKGGNPDPHVGEDEDTYRFVEQAAANVGVPLTTVSDGRDIWEVFKDERYLGNTRIASCSHILKQRPSRAWIEANCDPDDTRIYVGIDWTETHRIPAITRNYLPFVALAPLAEPPYLSKDDMRAWARRQGLQEPRLYEMGFPHNNCGGGCVKAGQGQFKLLLEKFPERFDTWAAKEQEMREHLGKDVAILRDRRGGTTKPLPLIELKRRVQCGGEVDAYDMGSCGCFVDEDPDAWAQPELELL